MSKKRTLFEEVSSQTHMPVKHTGSLIDKNRAKQRIALRRAFCVGLVGILPLIVVLFLQREILLPFPPTILHAIPLGSFMVGSLLFLPWHGIPTGWAKPLFFLLCLLGVFLSFPHMNETRQPPFLVNFLQNGLAYGILGAYLWGILLLGDSQADRLQKRRRAESSLKKISTALMHLAFLQILLGIQTAALHAGSIYTDWPWMDQHILPPIPFSTAFFETPAWIQFFHRITGYLLILLSVFFWWKLRKSAYTPLRKRVAIFTLGILLQAGLGVVSLYFAAQWHIALTHLVVALFLWLGVVSLRHLAFYPVQQSVKRGY